MAVLLRCRIKRLVLIIIYLNSKFKARRKHPFTPLFIKKNV